jgi:hypothetical protein
MSWSDVKNKIIGLIYAASFLNQGPVEEIMNFILQIVNDCGYIYKPIEVKNKLLYAIIAGTSPRYKFIIKDKTELYISALVNKIVYSNLNWREEKKYKEEILDAIFTNMSDDTKENLTDYVGYLSDSEMVIPESPPTDLIATLHGIIKLLNSDDQSKSKSISLIVDEIVNFKHVNKVLTNAIIGAIIGYTDLYEHQPFFQERDKVDKMIRFYLKYLSGENNRILLGSFIFEKDSQQIMVRRFMHPQNMPTPAGPWHENELPSELNQLAKLKRVSYVEDPLGFRFQHLLAFAKRFYSGEVKNPDKIISVDKEVIAVGAKAKGVEINNIIDAFF